VLRLFFLFLESVLWKPYLEPVHNTGAAQILQFRHPPDPAYDRPFLCFWGKHKRAPQLTKGLIAIPYQDLFSNGVEHGDLVQRHPFSGGKE